MKGKLTISIPSILMIMLFIIQFVSFPYFPWYDTIKYGFIVIIGVFVVRRYKVFLNKKYRIINCLAILFGGLTIYSSFINRNQTIERNPFLSAIIFVITYLLFLFFIEIMVERKKIKKMIDVFYKTAFIIAILTDIIMFLKPELVSIHGNNYFIGTKFRVVYLHLILIALYLAKLNFQSHQKKFQTKRMLSLSIWSILVGLYVKCATGVVGLLLLYPFIHIINKNKRILLNWIPFTIVQLFCFSFVYINELILNNPLIQSFILHVLKRDITLTARTRIFNMVPELLTGNTVWGFGYGTSYELGMKLGGFPNTQNAVLEWIWQVGIHITIIMLIMFAFILYFTSKNLNDTNKNAVIPILACIYIMTVLGMVEITIDSIYFALLILILGMSMEECKSKKRERLYDYKENA